MRNTTQPKNPVMPVSETRLQALCFQWHWNNFPAYRGLLQMNNNTSPNAFKGTLNKAMGVVKGVSDLEYFFAGKSYFIELKTETGNQSREQKQFQSLIERQGGEYALVRSLEAFQLLIGTIHVRHQNPDGPTLAFVC